MQSLLERTTEYALSLGFELLIVDGPAIDRYTVACAGPRTIIMLESGTAHGSSCGEVVYRACEQIASARALQINLHRATTFPIPS